MKVYTIRLMALCAFLCVTFSTRAQVVISSTPSTPHPSAMLDVQSTAKGVIISSMTTAQRDAIPTPADGLMIWNITTGFVNYYDALGLLWYELTPAPTQFWSGSLAGDISNANAANVNIGGVPSMAWGKLNSTTSNSSSLGLETSDAFGWNWLQMYNTTGYLGYMGSFTAPDDIDFGTSGTGQDVHFVTQATPRATLKYGGNMGFRTMNPGATTHAIGAYNFYDSGYFDFYNGGNLYKINAAHVGESSLTNATYTDQIGVVGYATGSDPGQSEFNLGGYFKSSGTNGANNYGVVGYAQSVTTAANNYGGEFKAYGPGTNYGVFALASGGSTNYAGVFSGDVSVSGVLSKSSGTFKIDHPQDPANKYLVHSFVESPEMMNIYNGNIITDANGDATVELPSYFDALNKDFRYQLTVIGSFAQAMVAEKVSGNSFKVKTNQPNIEVSWQVTGVRQDAWANAHRVVAEVPKTGDEAGKYISPELFGQTDLLNVNPALAEQAKRLAAAGGKPYEARPYVAPVTPKPAKTQEQIMQEQAAQKTAPAATPKPAVDPNRAAKIPAAQQQVQPVSPDNAPDSPRN